MKRLIGMVICISLILSMLCLPLPIQGASAQSYNSVSVAVLNSADDYVIWESEEVGERNVCVRLKKGSNIVVTPVISGVTGEQVEISADDDNLYTVGKYNFNMGDTLKFSTDSSAVIDEILDFKSEKLFDKTEAVVSGSWNKTSSSWLDYDGTKAWYNGTSAYWEFTGISGENEIYYYVPEKAVGSNLWNTLITLVKLDSDQNEQFVSEIEMKTAPEKSGWVSLFTTDMDSDETYRIKVEKGRKDVSGISDAARLCGVKIVTGDKMMPGSGLWKIPSGTGMANASLYVNKGTCAKVEIKASENKTIDINAENSGYFELGNHDFTNGGTVKVTNINGSNIRMLKVVPTNVLYLDTTTASEINDLFKSSIPGFNSAAGYYGNGGASWTIPSAVSGLSEIYYYIPDVSNGTCPCSALITYTADDGTKIERIINGSEIASGWHKLGVFDLSGSGAETLNVSRYTAESYSTAVRVYGFKIIETPDVYRNYIFTPESFVTTGDWSVLNGGTYLGKILQSNGVSASASITAELENGRYYVYVYDCDFSDYNTGGRNFTISLNDTEYRKTEKLKFGMHQLPGTGTGTADNNTPVWEWEQPGVPMSYVDVTDGKLKLGINPASIYARVEMVFVTNNPFMTVSDVNDSVFSATRIKSPAIFEDSIPFPESYKGEMSSVEKTCTLSNDNTEITFKLGTLDSGKITVQRETKVEDTVTNTFESGLGFLSIRADEAIKEQTQGYYAKFNVGFNTENGYEKIDSQNVFVCGKPTWLIPDTLEQTSQNSVKMTANSDDVLLTAVWTLEEGDLEPKVDIKADIKNDGVYTFGFFNDVNEIPESEVGYILNPYRWQEKRMPAPGLLLRESSSTTSHTQMTYKMNSEGQEITLGVAVDGSSIEKGRWTHDISGYARTDYYGNEFTVDYTDEQSNFALGSIGHNGGVQPVVFAPLLTTEDSKLDEGDSYSFSYRPLATVSTEGENRGWYDCYHHVAKDLRGVYDYRDNYYDSMTNTVFNLSELAMDDFYGGWDKNMVGHYNIEDTYWVTNANGLAYMQNYLLTEDDDVLMRRTLPSLATLLTRGSELLNSQWSVKSRTEGPINKELLTSPVPTMGNTTYEGAYLLSRGTMPVFRNIAATSLKDTGIEKGGITVKNPSETLWYDYARGDNSLSTARENADKYLEKRIFASADNYVSEETFVNISHTPDIQSQLDLYEATGEQKYLDGAIEAARRFLPLLRTEDVPEDKSKTVVLDAEQLLNEAKIQNSSTWWYNGEGYRRGADMYVSSETTDNGSVAITRKVKGPLEDALVPTKFEYPEWVTGRTGLGVEQFATCAGANRNVYMSTWASDLLRAGYLSDDQLIMDMARCAVVGRFENYPGYYIGGYNPVVGTYDYPYKGFDTTNLYFHHIPVLLASLQDFLFSNAYVKSDGNVDFPYTRAQGYAWFNNRIYGHESGKIYAETDMWPWLKKGTITVSSKQIDWIAGRKDGRAAFVLTNAGDSEEPVTVTLNSELGVKNGAKATIYDKYGAISYEAVTDNKLELKIPRKGILTFAVDGSGIHTPSYATVKFDKTAKAELGNTAIGLMYEGKTYTKGDGTYSVDTGYDVKAYALSIDPENYMGYVFVGGRSTDELGGDGDKGIVKTTLKWHYEGEDEITVVEDDYFPYEFFIPVNDRTKNIMFNVETEYKDGIKTLAEEAKIIPAPVEVLNSDVKYSFRPISMSVINALGSVSSPLINKVDGKSKYCIASADVSVIPFDVSERDALVGCHLSGYLKVKDIASTTDIIESGYILFNNVPIVESVVNSSKNNRLDFSVGEITYVNDISATKEYVDGIYVGELQGMLNGKNNYEWDNLYITNASEKQGLKITKNGEYYTISNDGAGSYFVVIATLDGDRMSDVELESIIVSQNNSKIYRVSDNQKLFVWNNDVNKGTTMQPVK